MSTPPVRVARDEFPLRADSALCGNDRLPADSRRSQSLFATEALRRLLPSPSRKKRAFAGGPTNRTYPTLCCGRALYGRAHERIFSLVFLRRWGERSERRPERCPINRQHLQYGVSIRG